MPVYEYKCEDCGKRVEFLHKTMNSSEKHKCPHCGSSNLSKVFSEFCAGCSKNDTSSACDTGGCCPGGTCGF